MGSRAIMVAGVAVASLVVGGAAGAALRGDADDWHAGAMMSAGRADGWITPSAGGMMSHAYVRDEEQFLVEMVAHHEEAIEAAGELSRSSRAAVRDLGARIVASQSAQVDLMRGWLDRWYPGWEPATDYRPMMRELDGLSGDDLDRTFLEDMLDHHMAAIMMSQQLLLRGLAEHPAVARLAADVRDDQHAEVVTMARWLREWFDD